jgi:aspartyl-tRNA(Asn)/glutamyl-tRNA(Gln) amidotransferase subunit B
VPVAPDQSWQSEVAASLGPMPAARRAKLAALFGPELHVGALASQIQTVVNDELDTLVTSSAAAGIDPELALARTANWAAAQPDRARQLSPALYVALLRMEQDGTLNATQSKAVLAEMLEHGGDPSEIARRKGFEAIDVDLVASAVRQIVEAHPEEFDRYKSGDNKVVGFFVGLAIEATGNRAVGKAVTEELRRLRG